MLEGKNLTYYYMGFSNRALSDVTITIPSGQIVGLVGLNGAGKTTLLQCLMGLIRPAAGEVSLDGQSGEGIRGSLAFISGEGAFLGKLTPAGTGDFLGDFYPRFDQARYARLCAFFELPDRPIGSLSKGQKAKAELAAGFSRGAQYILMDEPFSGKDAFTRRDFLKIMAGSLHGTESIVLSTHLVDEVESFLDRALLLHEGKLLEDVMMDDLRERGETLMSLFARRTGYDPARALAACGPRT